MAKLVKVSFAQCRLEFFKEQFESAKRKLEWAVKHNPNCYVVAEKADIYNFYEWAVKQAEKAVAEPDEEIDFDYAAEDDR